MRITFIRPNFCDARSTDAMEPIVFAILAALTPAGVEVSLVDERLEPVPYDQPTDLVAITVETYNARHSYQIAARYRQRGVPVVMGGYHATFLPQEALQYGMQWSSVTRKASGLRSSATRRMERCKRSIERRSRNHWPG